MDVRRVVARWQDKHDPHRKSKSQVTYTLEWYPCGCSNLAFLRSRRFSLKAHFYPFHGNSIFSAYHLLRADSIVESM